MNSKCMMDLMELSSKFLVVIFLFLGYRDRLNSQNFRILEFGEWNFNLKSSDCRALKIIWNDTKLEWISWILNIKNTLFKFCVGVLEGFRVFDQDFRLIFDVGYRIEISLTFHFFVLNVKTVTKISNLSPTPFVFDCCRQIGDSFLILMTKCWMCDFSSHKTIQLFLIACYFWVMKLNLTMTF